MKRGLSLITSLMLTASVFGGAASQAFNYKNISVVSAADASPVIGIGNPTYNGITRVPVGSKKAVIPVIVTSSDMLTAVVELEVTAAKGANPTITGISEVVKNITVNEAVSNERSFIWNAEGLKAPSIDGKVIANVEITFPDDAAKDSEYTLKIKSVDAADFDKTKGYAVDKDKSDFSEKIIFGAEAAEDYTLSFAENADSKWNPTKKITVKAGQTVPVGLEIQYPSDNIGAVVFDLDITDGAKVTGYEKGAVGEIDVSEANILNAVWTIPGKFNGYKFEEMTHLGTVNVEIPKDAKPGSKYTLSMVKEDTSTGDKKTISSASLPSVELVVEDSEVVEPVQGTIELEIGTVEVTRGTKTAQVPVYVKNGDATAIVAMFEAQLGAKVTAIEAAGVEGDVSIGETSNLVIWNNKFTGKVTDHKFSAEGEKLLVLTVALPDASDVTEYPVVFIEKELDVADANKVKVKTTIKNGAVKIIEPEVTTTPVPSETTPAVTTTPAETTTAKPGETTPAETTTAKPGETTPASTTTAKPGETTPVETTVAPVTTTATTTSGINIIIDPGFDPSDASKRIEAQIISEDYVPEFYYHHEESFRLPPVNATLSVNVIVGEKEDTIPLKLTEKNFDFPKDETGKYKNTPANVYDDTKFSYKIPLVLNVDSLDIDAELKTQLKAKGEMSVNLPVYIGQLGDFTLDHKVNAFDATGIKRERLVNEADDESIIESDILAKNTAAKNELGKYLVEFSKFLADTNMDKEFNLFDSTYIHRACLERSVNELPDMVHIPLSIWKSVGAIK